MKEPVLGRLSHDATKPSLLHLCIVLLILNCAIRVLFALELPLSYEEAYFWEWARFPSLGYLDYPPMVAWVIGSATWPSGSRSPIVIRAGTLLLGTGSLLLIYRLALQLFNRTVALRALLLALCLPMLNIAGTVILPDGPLLFFHLLALNLLVPALRNEHSRGWYLGGVALGAALLSKLMAIFTMASLFMFLLLSPSQRFWLKRKELYIGLIIAILIFSPFLYWNLTNDWASFRLQLWERHKDSLGVSVAKLGEFLFEQFANTSIFLVLPLVGGLFISPATLPLPWRGWYRLIKYQSVTILGFFLIVGTITQTHPQWTVLAYPTAAIALAVLWTSMPTHRLVCGLRWWIGLSYVTLVLAACLIVVGASVISPLTLKELRGPLGRGMVKGQMRLFGWSDLRLQLDPFLQQVGTDGGARLFTDGYERAAQLSFHHEGPPVINLEAYLRRGKGTGNAQWYYLPVEQLGGKSGIFLTDLQGMTPEQLRQIFQSADEVGIVEQRSAGHVLGRYRVFRVEYFQTHSMNEPLRGP